MKTMLKRQAIYTFLALAFVGACLSALLSGSLAWYGSIKDGGVSLTGSVSYVARYFESGDGSCAAQIVEGYKNGEPVFNTKKDGSKYTAAEHEDVTTAAAYEIKTPDQLYNLAWLQYLGYFNGSTKYYFYLSQDLDMTGYTLPPIGTKGNPFVGSFDGCGHTISNLTVSNRMTNDMKHGSGEDSEMPLQAYEEMTHDGGSEEFGSETEIVGLFGVVGEYDGKGAYSRITAEIKNVNIEGITVQSGTSSALAGLAAGYVNGEMENVTVTGSIEATQSGGVDVPTTDEDGNATTITTDKLSYYTTVGYTTKLATLDVTDVTHDVAVKQGSYSVTAPGSDWGSSIAMDELFYRLKSVRVAAERAKYYSSLTRTETREDEDDTYVPEDENVGGLTEGTSTLKYYNLKDDYASYSFEGNSNYENETFLYLTGADRPTTNSNATMTETITRVTTAYNVFTICNNGKYLNRSGTTVTAGDTGDTGWLYMDLYGSNYLVTYDGDTQYFLCANSDGTLSLTTERSSASQWKKGNGTSDNASTFITGGKALYYDGSTWKVGAAGGSTPFQIKATGTAVRSNNSETPKEYYLEDTALNSSKYYTKENTEGATWNLEPASGGGYCLKTGTGYLQMGTEVTDVAKKGKVTCYGLTLVNNRDAATVWSLKESSDNQWKLSTTQDGKDYYLNICCYQDVMIYVRWLACTNESGDVRDQTSASKTSSFNAILTLEGYTVLSSADFDLTLKNTGETKEDEYKQETTGNARLNLYDTIFPITIITQEDLSENSPYPTGGYETAEDNTGYFVGGTNEGSSIRVSKYDMNDLSDFAASNTYNDSALTVRTRTATSNGVVEVNEGNAASLGLKNYNDYNDGEKVKNGARTNLKEMMESDINHIYGLHFMSGKVSEDNLATRPEAKINGGTYYNYQMPRNCIDFKVSSGGGLITFFAGTYYNGNDSFFSLYKITRNNGNIKSIDEIKKIYESSDGTYVYQYGATTPDNVADDDLVFDLSWITDPTIVMNAVYYFEIPVNEGEYALGSTSGTGAYLFYLDICADPNTGRQKVTRTVTTETITNTLSTYEYPVGVGFGTVEDAAISLPFGSSAAVTVDGTGVQLTDGSGGAVSRAACSYARPSAAGDPVTVTNGGTAITAVPKQTSVTTKVIETTVDENTHTKDTVTQRSVTTKVDGVETAPVVTGDTISETGPAENEYTYLIEDAEGKDGKAFVSYTASGPIEVDATFTYEADPLLTYSDAITITLPEDSTVEQVTVKNFKIRDGFAVSDVNGYSPIGEETELTVPAADDGGTGET